MSAAGVGHFTAKLSQTSTMYRSHLPTRLLRHKPSVELQFQTTGTDSLIQYFITPWDCFGVTSSIWSTSYRNSWIINGTPPPPLPLQPRTDQSSLNMTGLCSSLWPPDISSLAGQRSCFPPELRESQRERARSAVGSL